MNNGCKRIVSRTFLRYPIPEIGLDDVVSAVMTAWGGAGQCRRGPAPVVSVGEQLRKMNDGAVSVELRRLRKKQGQEVELERETPILDGRKFDFGSSSSAILGGRKRKAEVVGKGSGEMVQRDEQLKKQKL